MADFAELAAFCAYPAVDCKSFLASDAALLVALPTAVVAEPTPATVAPGAKVGQNACIVTPVAVVKPPTVDVACPTLFAVSAPF